MIVDFETTLSQHWNFSSLVLRDQRTDGSRSLEVLCITQSWEIVVTIWDQKALLEVAHTLAISWLDYCNLQHVEMPLKTI